MSRFPADKKIPALLPAIWLCIAVLSVSLAGCGGDRRNQQSVEAVTNDLISDTEEPDAEGRDSAAETEEADYSEGTQDLRVSGAQVLTQFCVLTVPDEWRDNVTYRYYQFPAQKEYRLEIFENTSAVATDGVGGRVVSLIMTGSYGEEKSLKTTEYLGRLVHENGSFLYVLAEYPAHEQFTESSRVAYDSILAGARTLRERIEGVDGYTFEAGAPAGTQDEEAGEE